MILIIRRLLIIVTVTAAGAVVVLPFTFVTSLILKSDPTFLTQTSNFYAYRFKNPRPNHFFSQIGTDLQIHQLSCLISSRSSWERLKRKILNQIYLVI